ncbi:MAG: tryptophan synthase subunit alpha [Planctomycetes bacterium]|nr:tryptophan synthase subunit alpha [Planctomycetota bacterium]
MSPKLLIPFLTAGFPTRAKCLDLLKACAAGGADRIELGIPFSDPLADGPVIQAASQAALRRGVTLVDAFALAEKFRERPLILMGYLNPILQFILPRFFNRCRRTGVSGVIVPDLPPEESAEARAAAAMAGVPLIFLCAPTTTDARVRLIDRLSRDFIYLVSMKGVTGGALPRDVGAFVRRVRRLTRRPLCVGFGISTPKQARAVASVADGVIVGSALLRIVQQGGGPRDVERFVAAVRQAIDIQ